MTAPRLNGCHNRKEFAPTVLVQDGWHSTARNGHLTREPNMVAIPFRMAPDCRYTLTDLGQADAACAGCKHRVEGGTS